MPELRKEKLDSAPGEQSLVVWPVIRAPGPGSRRNELETSLGDAVSLSQNKTNRKTKKEV